MTDALAFHTRKPSNNKEVLVDTVSVIVAVVVILVIAGAAIALSSSRRRSSERLREELGPEYDRTLQAMGGEKKAQTELEQRRKRVEALNIRPLAEIERTSFLAAWTAVQSKFVDEPGQAIVDADHLIILGPIVKTTEWPKEMKPYGAFPPGVPVA
jgi:ABC-type multidrug transport system fused ATPase/permease subunit